MASRVTVGWLLGAAVLAAAASANAQTGSSGASAAQSPSTTQTSQSSTAPAETRPATTTFLGDTGLWFVPTAEVLPKGKWSASGYRRGTNYIQGYTNVADFAGTFAFGVKDRAEIFGSFLVDTRIDRDVRPLFLNDANPAKFGGIIDRYPGVNQYWSGDNIGDFYLGAKVNFLSEHENDPAAVALRGILKLPTANTDNGAGTGKLDFLIDGIVSKEAAKKVDVSGYVGWEFRGNPDGYDIPSGAFRWGAGVGFPSRSPLRVTGEFNGTMPTSDTATITGAVPKGIDATTPPPVSAIENLTRATVGLTWQTKKGMFFGAGVSWNTPTNSRISAFSQEGNDVTGDYVDWQFRLGYHPGVRTYVPPPPPPAPAPVAAPAPPQNRPPTVKAQCDPCSVEVGKTSTVTANAQDPDGDTLTYRWTAPSGTLANPAERSTVWTAPNTEGTVPVTVTVNDGKGGTASDTVNIQVTRAPVKSYTFEDVHFDFDRYTLRPEATRVLDEAVNAMRQDQTLRLTIEGHTCNIGTAEYNLALGNRRAVSVRDYLVSRGVSADRLNTVSYGEERPKYDNAREETRRLNRRAALTVRLQ
jgi:outer membrane protein OmpA-like peptidoglycan-associated protein